MFTTRTPKNRIVERDLSIRYNVEKVDYTNSGGSTASWYKVTRRADKKYRYDDLTQVGAMNVASELVKLYTRDCAILLRRGENQTKPDVQIVGMLQSKIVPTRKVGSIWSVDVTVDETDVRSSVTNPSDPASLFSAENARDYDDGGMILEIDRVTALTVLACSSALICFKMPVTSTTGVVIQYTQSSGGDWISTSQLGEVTWLDNQTALLQVENSIVADQTIVRARSGIYVSNEVMAVSTTIGVSEAKVLGTQASPSGGRIICSTVPSSVSMPSAKIVFANQNVSLYGDSREGMTWTGNTCAITSTAPILLTMNTLPQMFFISGSDVSNSLFVTRSEYPSVRITNLFSAGSIALCICECNAGGYEALQSQVTFYHKSAVSDDFTAINLNVNWEIQSYQAAFESTDSAFVSAVSNSHYFKLATGGMESPVFSN